MGRDNRGHSGRLEAAVMGGDLQWYGHTEHPTWLLCGFCRSYLDSPDKPPWVRLSRRGVSWRLRNWSDALANDDSDLQQALYPAKGRSLDCDGQESGGCTRRLDDRYPIPGEPHARGV